jgi:hypothetical protein
MGGFLCEKSEGRAETAKFGQQHCEEEVGAGAVVAAGEGAEVVIDVHFTCSPEIYQQKKVGLEFREGQTTPGTGQ